MQQFDCPNCDCIEAGVLVHRLRCSGHITRRCNSIYYKQVLYGQFANGRSSAIKKPYKDGLEILGNLTKMSTHDKESHANERFTLKIPAGKIVKDKGVFKKVISGTARPSR